MKKRIRKQLSMILIVAMVFSSSVGVYADEVRDDPGVSENTTVMPQAGAGAELPGTSGQQAEMPEEKAAPSDNAAAPESPGEPVSENTPDETVSEDEILPEEEEGIYEPEEQAGAETAEDRLVNSIKNASHGAVIKLSENVTLTKCLEIGNGKNITIDLSGNKITGTGSKITDLYSRINCDNNVNHQLVNKFLISVSGSGTAVTLTDSKKSGSITYDTSNYTNSDSIVAVWDGAALTLQDITLTAYSGKVTGAGSTSAMTTGAKGVMVVGNTARVTTADEYYSRPETGSKVVLNSGASISDAYIGVYAIGSGATVMANEGCSVAGVNAAIQNQGELSFFGTDITVNGGAIVGTVADSDSIYHAGGGKLTVNGGTFLGATAIEVSNGIAEINGGETSVSANIAFDKDLVQNYALYSGSTTAGCAITFSPYANYTGVKCALNIKGGDFKGHKGLYIKNRNKGTDDNLKNDVRLSVAGGKFTASDANGAVVRESFSAGIMEKFLTGGSFNTDPSAYLADGYGVTSEEGYNKVIQLIRAYIRPALEQGDVVVKGQSLSQAGLHTVLVKENGEVIADATVSGVSYYDCKADGTISGGLVTVTASCDRAGTYYIAAKDDGAGIRIGQNGQDRTGYYFIPNKDTISADYLFRYTVKDLEEKDGLLLVQKKEIYYSGKIDSVYDYFDVFFTMGDTRQELTKASGVEFFWNGGNVVSDSFDCSGMDAGTEITVSANYLKKSTSAVITIMRLPIYVKATKEVSSLVGGELTERYYGQIDVYKADDAGKMSDQMVASGNKARIEEWFDSTSSVIDLTGISNMRKHEGYKAVLKDLGRLKSDPDDDKEKNYELSEKPWVIYNVNPSVIFDFRDATQTDEIAPTKIRRADDTTPMTIYSFSNDQPTSGAKWCVKTVRFDSIENSWIEEMKEISTIGIKSDPTVDGKGTKFTFSREFVDGNKDKGGRFTLYEIFSEDVTASDNNMSLTVRALQPVIFNGNKFVAKDDTRYYSRGIIKNGYSPSLDVRVYDGTKKLSFGSDYTLTYKYNKNAGNKDSENRPTVIVTGKGDYSEMKITAYFVILPADLEYASDVSVTTQYIKYSGKVLKPKIRAVYAYGANAGKTIPASAYDITVFDEDGRDVTAKKYNSSARAGKYTVVLTANGSNPNISGSTSDPAKAAEPDEAGNGIYFYGIPKTSKKMTVGGTLSKVTYPLAESVTGIDSFLDKDKFYAKTAEKKYNYQDIDRADKEGSISIDLVSGKDECTAVVYDEKDITGETLNSGVYYLKIQYATAALKQKYYVFEPTYVKVTYAGTKLKADDIKLKKKSFDFSSGDEYTDLELKLSKRIDNRGTDGIKLYVFQNGTELDLSDLREENYVIKGDALSNNRAGRYRIRVEGTGSYYGAYDLTYTVGVQAYNKDKTPVAVFVNTADPQNPEDETERAVHYRPDGQYDDSMVKVVWTKTGGEKEVLQPRGASGNEAGDYYVVWSTFKQVGPKKGTVTIVGTGTRFTGKIKKKFDVDQAE